MVNDVTEVERAAGLAGTIMTVRGPIPPSELGITLSHDHILLDAWDLRNQYDVILDDEELAREELEAYAAVGGGAICDPTNIGLGRDPERLRRLSEATGVHIVMGAGWYREKLYPPEVWTTSTNALADLLVAEITDGVADSGVRPGFIGEIGTERGAISPAQERVFRAAARAHRRTGVPLLTHTTHWGELALDQLDLFADEGVDASAVIVSHLGDRRGIRHVLPIVERGAWASVDNLAFVSGYAPVAFRADNVAALCAAGYAEQVMLSNDICELGQLAAYGGVGYGNVITNFVPMLRERGVSEESIHTMLVENPARAFAFRDMGS